MIKKITMVCLLLAFLQSVMFSQFRNPDSLLKSLAFEKSDTLWIKTANRIVKFYGLAGDTNAAFKYFNLAIERARKIHFERGVGISFTNLAMVYERIGRYSKSTETYDSALTYFRKIDDKYRVAAVLGNKAIVYYNYGNWEKAITGQLEALKIFESIKDTEGVCNTKNTIGNIFLKTGDTLRALSYYKAALQQSYGRYLNIMANAYSNIGIVHLDHKRADSALYYFRTALQFRRKKNSHDGNIPVILNNMGHAWTIKRNTDSAEYYYQQAFNLRKESKDYRGVAITAEGLANFYLSTGKIQEALRFSKVSLAFASDIKAGNEIKNAFKVLYESYAALKKYDSAFYYQGLYFFWKDSLLNSEKSVEVMKKEAAFVFEKKEQDLKHENELKQAELEKQKLITWFAVGGGSIMLLLLIIAIRSYRAKRKANLEIALQKDIIEEKQKEILDSIRYARRIQQSLLTNEKYIDRELKKNSGKGI